MTRFATLRQAIGGNLRHARFELAFVRIFMAGGAAQPIKVIDNVASAGRRFVAIDARHRDMSTGEHKARLLMTRQVKYGCMKGGLVVALLATVEVGSASELAFVYVLVAIDACGRLNLEYRGAAFRNMALCALHIGVLLPQRKRCGFVVSHRVLRRLKAVNRMAGFTFAPIGALQELSAVRIGLVTIGAEFERDRSLEIAAAVAGVTAHVEMLSQKWVFGLGMIKLSHERALLPGSCTVAGLAALFEFAAMGIVVALRASVELQSNISNRTVGARGVAFLAGNLAVQSRQSIFRLGVIEDSVYLPVFRVVALLTVGPKLAFVLVFVAASTIARKPEVGTIAVLHLY